MVEVYSEVKSELQGYADRGIFQNFSAPVPKAGSAEFRFNWLAENPFSIRLNMEKCELELRNILPSIPFRSSMDKDFREFLTARSDESIPVHRRLDSERFDFQCKNRQENLSVTIGFNSRDAGDAAKASINLLHEIFNNFLIEGPYQNYMVEVFNVPEE
jgi:hypothetical protein